MSKKKGDGTSGKGPGDDSGGDYEVGYKKPPIHSRWKKGQSGNKKGRPKKKLGLSDIEKALDEALSESLAVNDNGTVRKIKKLKALAIQTVNKALKGHHPSANLLMAHYARRTAGGAEEAGASATADEFKAEMEVLFGEIAAKSQSAEPPSGEPKPKGDSEDGAGASDEAPSDTKH